MNKCFNGYLLFKYVPSNIASLPNPTFSSIISTQIPHSNIIITAQLLRKPVY